MSIYKSPNKIILIFLAIIFGIFGLAGSSLAADFYVATTGNNSNSGTIDKPFLTIMYAINKSGPGDTIYIRSGTYAEAINIQKTSTIPYAVGRGGSAAGGYKTIRNYPGEEPILTGNITIADDWLIFDGLRLDNNAISMSNNLDVCWNVAPWNNATCNAPPPKCANYRTNIQLKNLKLRGRMAIYAGRINVVGTNIVVDNSDINIPEDTANPTNSHGIYISGGHAAYTAWFDQLVTDNVQITNNTIRGVAAYPIHAYNEKDDQGSCDGHSVNDLTRIIRNVYVHGNTFYPSYNTGIFQVGGNTRVEYNNVYIYNNIIMGGNNGVRVQTFGSGTVDNTYIYNNTFYRQTNSGVYVGGNTTGIYVKNNLFYEGSTSVYHVQHADTTPNEVFTQNNLYFPSPAKLLNTTDSAAKLGDPLFTAIPGTDQNPDTAYAWFYDGIGKAQGYYTHNYDNNVYILQFGSPAIDSGIVVSEPTIYGGSVVVDDFVGRSRPQGAAYDIGAYEYISGASADTTPPSAPTGLSVI